MPAGLVLAMGASDRFFVENGANLSVTGSVSRPVVITNNPSNTAPWRGLFLRDEGVSLLNCIVENANADGIRIEDAAVSISNCRITGHGADGVEIIGSASPTLTGNVITTNIFDGVRANLSAIPTSPLTVEGGSVFGNFGFGINNLSSDFDVIATNNYWGDDTGPSDLSDDRDTGGWFNQDGSGIAFMRDQSVGIWRLPERPLTVLSSNSNNRLGATRFHPHDRRLLMSPAKAGIEFWSVPERRSTRSW